VPSGSEIPKKTKENTHNNTNRKPTTGYDEEANIGSTGNRPRHNQWGTTLTISKGDCTRNICAW
jgi:hypothetical protein